MWTDWLNDLRRARQNAAARRELERFDDVQLADLGIHRSQIAAYVDGLAGPRRRRPMLRVITNSEPICCPPCCAAAA